MLQPLIQKWQDTATWLKVVGGAVAALAGAVVAVPAAWTTLDLPKLATHKHVDGRVGPLIVAEQAIKQQLTDVLVRQEEKDLADLMRARFQWSARMKELPPGSPAQADYEWRIRQIDVEVSKTERRIRDLKP